MTVATNTVSSDRKPTAAEKKARKQHLKTTKNRPTDIEEGWTLFRAAEKKYKAKWPVPDLSGVLDFGEDEEEHHNIGAEHAGVKDMEVTSGKNIWRGRRDAVEWTEIDFPNDAEKAGGNGRGKKAYIFPSVPGTNTYLLYAVHTHPILQLLSATSFSCECLTAMKWI
jgi:alkylated DNA repair protein alkB homolog 1